MKKTTIIFIVLVLALILGGGGWWLYSTQKNITNTDTAASLEELLEKQESHDRDKVLVIGYAGDYPPMEFKNALGQLVGFDVDLINKVEPMMGKELVLRPIQWRKKLDLLNSKEIDLVWSGLTITEERKKDYLFSTPYLESEIAVVVKMSSKVFVDDDLSGLTVGIENGAPTEQLENFSTADGGTVKIDDSFADAPSALSGLLAGKVDAVVMDRVVADYYSARTPSTFRVLQNVRFGSTDFAVAARKDNSDLIEKLNTALEKLKADDDYQAIHDKWFK